MVRYKNRYLTLELVWPAGSKRLEVDTPTILTAIRMSLQLNFGDLGLGQSIASLQVKYLNPVTNTCVVRCGREHSQQVWAAITLITELNRRAVLLQVVNHSGNVQTCRQDTWKYEAARLNCLRAETKVDPNQFDSILSSARQNIANIET